MFFALIQKQDEKGSIFLRILRHFSNSLKITFLLWLAATGMVWAQAAGNLGTDFWLTFPQADLANPPRQEELLISSAVATSGTVAIPGLGFNTPFNVPAGGAAGGMATVMLPITCMPTGSDVTAALGVHVTALNPVAVMGMSNEQASSDAYLALPTNTLGQNYITLSYNEIIEAPVTYYSEFAVVGVQDGTVVTITPSESTGTRIGGVPYNINLNQGDVYQLQNDIYGPDLSGSLISSSNPVGVWGAVVITEIPFGTQSANYIVEQLWPTTMWGTNFFTVPLATRTGGDTFRFLASQNGTTVSVNGAPVITLNKGVTFEQILSAASQVTSNNPIYVMQYSRGNEADGVLYSDPSMMSVPPVGQYATSYQVAAPVTAMTISNPNGGPGFAENYENIVAPTSAVGNITLDGVAIPAGSFNPIGGSGYSDAAIAVSKGAHALAGSAPFGLFVYGFDVEDAYSYPGGLLMATPPPTNTPLPTNTPTVTPTPTPVCLTRVWPDPYNPKYGDGYLRFDCIPHNATLTIYTISGETVVSLPEKNGMVVWKYGQNSQNANVCPGVYLYAVQPSNNSQSTGKFLLMR
jgi:hypothetical protein